MNVDWITILKEFFRTEPGGLWMYLFNDIASSSAYMASIEKSVNDELERMWKEAVVWHYCVISCTNWRESRKSLGSRSLGRHLNCVFPSRKQACQPPTRGVRILTEYKQMKKARQYMARQRGSEGSAGVGSTMQHGRLLPLDPRAIFSCIIIASASRGR
jgi:hypothetical protein